MENETIYRNQQKTKKYKQYTPLRAPRQQQENKKYINITNE